MINICSCGTAVLKFIDRSFMDVLEKKGFFYLGKKVNPQDGKLTDQPLLFDAKDLTTHAVCVGMTGSGKTGLGITILEEAALNKIPAIIIDPKGDLGNLLLTFPSLSAEEFIPWIDQAEAEKNGTSIEAYAESVANTWKQGLAKWGENGERIQKFKNSADVVIYTPASKAGIPLSILSSFMAPSKEMMVDTGAIRDRILSITSSLLGLLGINADPIKSREHILISNIIQQAWEKGEDLDLASLIQQIQKPRFPKVGVLDIDTFYPAKDRLNLSVSLNNLLASPGFQAWMEGDTLDIDHLLHSASGKTKLAIISIAHLSDSERMFFVTLLLNEILTWMRRQSGTSNLRALMYMDEIFGYFPPTAMPPSKTPMLTLLKQARAYGLGIILATQNPVDLDYKGLANCGTWFIGKLQTERDKMRVLEGLSTASNGDIKTNELDRMLTLIGNRTFIMRSIHQKDPLLFQTRWSLSYLRGPLTLNQIEKLKEDSDEPEEHTIQSIKPKKIYAAKITRPTLPEGVTEYFLTVDKAEKSIHYHPKIFGLAKLHFVDAKNQIDSWQDICLVTSLNGSNHEIQWEEGENDIQIKKRFEDMPATDCSYDELPGELMQRKKYDVYQKNLASFLYQNQTLLLYKTTNPSMISKEGEKEDDFRARVISVQNEKRDRLIAELKEKYAAKIALLTDKARRAEDKMTTQKKTMVVSSWRSNYFVCNCGFRGISWKESD